MSLLRINEYIIDTAGNYAFNKLDLTANLTAGNANLGNISIANYHQGTLTTAVQPNITSVGTLSSVSVTGNVSSGGNIIGNGQYLTAITGGNVSGQVANALVAGTVYTNAQPNITSVGTLSSLTVTSNVTAGNANVSGTFAAANITTSGTSGNITGANIISANSFTATSLVNFTSTSNVALGAVGNIHITGGTSGQYLKTDGSGTLSWADAGNATAIINGTSNVVVYNNGNVATSVGGNANILIVTSTGANVTGYANVSGTFSASNITTSGTSGNISGANNITANYFIGNGAQLSAITGGNVSGQVSNALIAGTVYTAAQPNITSVGTLASVSVSGNVSSGGNIIGNGQFLTSLTGGNVSGQVANALVAGTVYTAAQPNITSVGTLASLTVSGLITATAGGIKVGNLQDTAGTNTIQLSSGNVSVTGNIVAGTGGTGNVTATYFIGNGSQLTGISAGSTYSNSNVATYLPTYTGNLSPGNLAISAFANLGVVGNIYIGGGTANYVLSTNGTGGLSWVAQGGSVSGPAVTVDNFTGDGANANFTLSVSPTSVNNVLVNYNGAIINRDSYSIAGNVITFGSTPAASSKIEISTFMGLSASATTFNTRTATGDGTTTAFTVTSNFTESTLLVMIDGVIQTPTTDYTVSGSTLTFTTAPYNGATVQIRELGIAVATGSGGGGGSALTIKDEGTTLTSAATSIDFVGSGVTATNTGTAVTVTVSGGAITVKDEGTTLTSTATSLDFVGGAVTATNVGNAVTVTLSNTVIRSQAMVMGILFGG